MRHFPWGSRLARLAALTALLWLARARVGMAAARAATDLESPGVTADQAVQAARSGFLALPGYRTTMRFFQKEGAREARGLYAVTGMPPLTIRIHIVKGTGQGTTLLWNGGPTAQVRPAGFLHFATFTLSITDDRLVSIRGYSLAQTNLDALLAQAANRQNRRRLVTATPPTVSVRGPDLLPGCVRMLVRLEPRTLRPVTIEAFDARQKVFEIDLSHLEVVKSPQVHL